MLYCLSHPTAGRKTVTQSKKTYVFLACSNLDRKPFLQPDKPILP